MGKAVLISIRPKWCELIANGKKTVEVRKTAPKLKPPFKCYIYCTKSTDHPRGWLGCYDHDMHKFGLISPLNIEAGKHMNIEVVSGYVIGEFICRNIRPVVAGYIHGACLTYDEVTNYLYLGRNGRGWGWEISDLVIYDKPKKLSEFNGICSKKALTDCECGTCNRLLENGNGHCPMDWIKRPPQSWCYVEELE